MGRRPGAPNSRLAVLNAARNCFARAGYDGTTIRRVAANARVDPSLVIQFFRSKEGLFAAILKEEADSAQSLRDALAGPRAGLGGRFTRNYLIRWEHPIIGARLQGFVRAMIGSPGSTKPLLAQMKKSLSKSGIPRAKHLGVMLAASHLLGVAISRYILEVPALVAPSTNELVRLLAPAIDRYLRLRT